MIQNGIALAAVAFFAWYMLKPSGVHSAFGEVSRHEDADGKLL